MEFGSDELEPALLEAGEDFADESTVDTIGLCDATWRVFSQGPFARRAWWGLTLTMMKVRSAMPRPFFYGQSSVRF